MTIKETSLEGCFIIEPKVFSDDRGYFFESFNNRQFKEKTGLNIEFVQDNEAMSSKGVLRGLHYQEREFAQAKLVRVISGSVQDVVVDLRSNSSTFGSSFSIILSGDNKKQLFIPKGFAHGYAVLENNTIFAYKCDEFYCQKSERGIVYNDTDLNINWQLKKDQIVLSQKDKRLPKFSDLNL